MTQANSALYRSEMRLGHEARELRGNHLEAIQHYLVAFVEAPDTTTRCEARQAAGVSYRVIGDLPEAKRLLTRAMNDALNNGAPLLAANIGRDLGKVYHAEAIAFHEAGNLKNALWTFHDADKLLRDSAQSLREHGSEYGALASDNFRGLLYLEWGKHVGAIRGYSTRCSGIDLLRHSVRGLKKIVVMPPGATKRDRTYEVNARINLMQASFISGLIGLPGALWLTRPGSPNHGSWKRVIAASLGNRAYRALMRRQQKN